MILNTLFIFVFTQALKFGFYLLSIIMTLTNNFIKILLTSAIIPNIKI
ncbi:hypothetical protein HC081234_00090 [Helicobacter cinaedi]|nr:hypothetical protein HC081234_00090 [Helicobacter cinaedi]